MINQYKNEIDEAVCAAAEKALSERIAHILATIVDFMPRSPALLETIARAMLDFSAAAILSIPDEDTDVTKERIEKFTEKTIAILLDLRGSPL